MAEIFLPDSELEALSNGQGSTGIKHLKIAQDPHYINLLQRSDWLDRFLQAYDSCRVYVDETDAADEFSVRASCSGAAVAYAGSINNSLTDDETNYIYLEADGELTVSITAFPNATTPHWPLATIVMAAGAFTLTGIADRRGTNLYSPCPPAVPAISAADEDGGSKRTITIQAAGGGSLAGRFQIRVWLAQAAHGAPDATGNTVAIETGTTLQTFTPDADYELMTDATGKVEIGVTIAGVDSRFVMASIDGRVVASEQLDWT